MKLSLSGFMFEDDYRSQSVSFADFATLAKEDGYEGVELRNTQLDLDASANRVDECRVILESNGLSVTCMTPRGLPIEMQERNERFARYLDLAEKMSCQLLKVTGEPRWLHKAARKAADRGIALAINTHINSPVETVAGSMRFLEKIDHPNFGLLYDPMHLAIAGEDCVAAIDRLHPSIRGVLVQCVRLAEGGISPVISHAGNDYMKTRIGENPMQDWPGIFRKLKDLGYDGRITVIENGWPENERSSVARESAQAIKTIWERA